MASDGAMATEDDAPFPICPAGRLVGGSGPRASRGLRESLLRTILDFAQCPAMLEKEAFRMASSGEEGCKLVNSELQEAILKILGDWIQAQDLGAQGLLEKAPGQPLHLRLIRAILQAADDPDRDFLLRAERGLSVGILELLPRTPHVFEEQAKWPLDSGTELGLGSQLLIG